MHSISQLFHLEKVENLIMGGFIALRALPGLLTDVVGVVLGGEQRRQGSLCFGASGGLSYSFSKHMSCTHLGPGCVRRQGVNAV